MRMHSEETPFLFVHASARDPGRWRYVTDETEAALSLAATQARITFCGHTHLPALFHAAARRVGRFRPVAGAPMPLLPSRRWLAVLGAVGQPRDRDPAACYGLFDGERSELTYVRAPYDVEAAAAKIRAAGLPSWLAER